MYRIESEAVTSYLPEDSKQNIAKLAHELVGSVKRKTVKATAISAVTGSVNFLFT